MYRSLIWAISIFIPSLKTLLMDWIAWILFLCSWKMRILQRFLQDCLSPFLPPLRLCKIFNDYLEMCSLFYDLVNWVFRILLSSSKMLSSLYPSWPLWWSQIARLIRSFLDISRFLNFWMLYRFVRALSQASVKRRLMGLLFPNWPFTFVILLNFHPTWDRCQIFDFCKFYQSIYNVD